MMINEYQKERCRCVLKTSRMFLIYSYTALFNVLNAALLGIRSYYRFLPLLPTNIMLLLRTHVLQHVYSFLFAILYCPPNMPGYVTILSPSIAWRLAKHMHESRFSTYFDACVSFAICWHILVGRCLSFSTCQADGLYCYCNDNRFQSASWSDVLITRTCVNKDVP